MRSKIACSEKVRRFFLIFASAVLASSFVFPFPARAEFSLNSQEQDFIRRINEYRVANGLNELLVSRKISEAADWMTSDMADHPDNLSNAHVDTTGGHPSDRCSRFGYSWGCGENLAAGYETGEEVFEAWRNSPGHNENMLYAGYTVMGISQRIRLDGRYNWYWINDFGSVIDDGDVVDAQTMQEKIIVTVTVKTKNGRPAAAAEVSVKNSKGQNLGGATADNTGIARVELASPEKSINVRVQAKYGGAVKVSKKKKIRPNTNKSVQVRMSR